MQGDVLLLATLLGLGLVLIGVWLYASRRRAVRLAAPPRLSDEALALEGERLAAPASEAIEDLVNQKLAGIPGMADTKVDFGTAADGSLEIWIGWERYASIDEINDPRIRQAVREAVEAFNR